MDNVSVSYKKLSYPTIKLQQIICTCDAFPSLPEFHSSECLYFTIKALKALTSYQDIYDLSIHFDKYNKFISKLTYESFDNVSLIKKINDRLEFVKELMCTLPCFYPIDFDSLKKSLYSIIEHKKLLICLQIFNDYVNININNQ